MKNFSYLFIVLFAILLSQSCQDDESNISSEKGSVVFSFTSSEISGVAKKETISKSIEAERSAESIVAVLISIEDEFGTTIYENERMDLVNVNGHYLTSPVGLESGNYFITDFIVVDDLNNAIYLTPKEDSFLAQFVSTPLSFSVTSDAVENINLEVIDTIDLKPEDFGYTSFSFAIVSEGTFGVSASIYNSEISGFELTDANIILKGDGTEIFSHNLEAEINHFPIIGVYNLYTIEISKDGYVSTTNNFTFEELLALNESPFNAVLLEAENIENSFTMVTDQTQGLNEVSIFFSVFLPEIEHQIDWGDGNIESYAADYSEITHTYADQQLYTITILGDSENINSVLVPDSNITEVNLPAFATQVNFGDNLISSIDLSSSINLNQLFLYNNQISSIDISNLEVLTYLNLSDNQLLSIDVSENILLNGLIVSNNQISTIDVSSNTILGTLIVSGNLMSSLNVSNNAQLQTIWAEDNQLSSLDVSNNANLQQLSLARNQITSIDLLVNTELLYLGLAENQITNLDLISNSKLTDLSLQNNQLTSLDISNQSYLQYVYINNNLIDILSLENIYNKVYDNALSNNIIGGELYSFGNAEPNANIEDYANALIRRFEWNVIY